MDAVFDEWDGFFAKWEKILNIPGYIPTVGPVIGGFRATAGKVMVIFSMISAALFLIASCLKPKGPCLRYANHCFQYILNGIANVIRGTIEAIPFSGLLLLSYDLNARLYYPAEIRTVIIKSWPKTV